MNTVLAATAVRPTGVLSLPNTGVADNGGSGDQVMFAAAIIALASALTFAFGMMLRRQEASRQR